MRNIISSIAVICFSAAAVLAQGRVSSRDCPYSCRTEGIPKEQCRDWKDGGRCFIEDMRYGAQQQGAATNASCKSGQFYPAPRIEVKDEDQVGSVFGESVRVRGVVEGTCITEAGYYEGGTLVERIPVNPVNEFRRFEFEVKGKADPDRRPEVRAYNVNGERVTYEVGEETYRARPREEDLYERRGSERSRPDDRGRGIGRAVDDYLYGQ